MPSGNSSSQSHTGSSYQYKLGANAPGYTTLYRGMDKARLDNTFTEDGAVVNIGRLFSNPQTDFHSSRAAFYFTVDLDIAQKYARYALARDNVSAVCIVRISIPNSAVESMSSTQLQRVYWPNAEWRALVWHCRRGARLPESLSQFKRATLVIGTIAKSPNRVYEAMESPDQITERRVMKTAAGRDAVQWGFNDDEGYVFINEHVALPRRVQIFNLLGKQLS